MKKALTGTALVAFSVAAAIAAGPVGVAVLGPTQLSSTTTAPGQIKKTATPAPTKSPTAEPPPKSLTFSPNPLTVSGLAPGISLDRTLTIENPNNQDVILQSVNATVLNPTPSPVNGLSCTSPADFEVILTNVTPTEIKRNSSKPVPVAIRLNNSATRNQDGCKGKTFTFVFTATATSK